MTRLTLAMTREGRNNDSEARPNGFRLALLV